MTVQITTRFLCLPVDKKSPVVKLHFYCHGEKFQEIDISLGADNVDFYGIMNVGKYIGQAVEIAGDIPAGAKEKIHCEDQIPFSPSDTFYRGTRLAQ